MRNSREQREADGNTGKNKLREIGWRVEGGGRKMPARKGRK